MSAAKFGLAATVSLLCMASCSGAHPASDAAPGHDARAPSESSAAPSKETSDPSRDPSRIAADEVVPAQPLGSWGSLFKRAYDDPGIIEGFLAEVRARPGARRTILLETTLSWGCACPTWVFPFHQDMDELQHVMVLPAPGLELDPTDLATPERAYRLTGHFNGEALTGLDWVRQREETPPNFPKAPRKDPEVQEYWAAPGLVFVVESWCFEENAQLGDGQWLRERGATECPN